MITKSPFKLVSDLYKTGRGRLGAMVVGARISRRGLPVIAVTGTNGKTTTVQLIDRILRTAGYQVGTSTTYGVYHDGVRVAQGDFSGVDGIRQSLNCRGLQALVAETGRGGLLRYGTGFSRCHVGVVTNVMADHLGLQGINTVDQMAEVKSRLVRRVDPQGTVVLNADDPRVAAMARLTSARLVYFSTEGRERDFERGWFFRDGWLCRKEGATVQRLLAASEMPMALGGHARYNVSNALAAMAATEGISQRLPIPRSAQLEVLRSYERDGREHPGCRYVLTRLHGHYVLLLRCKNPDAFRVEAPLIRRVQSALGCRYLVGVATAVGDRLEEYHREFSAEIAGLSDGVFLRPPLKKYARRLPVDVLIRRLSQAIPPEKLLSTKPMPVPEMIRLADQRLGGSFLLALFNACQMFDLDEYFREAEVVPIPQTAWTSA